MNKLLLALAFAFMIVSVPVEAKVVTDSCVVAIHPVTGETREFSSGIIPSGWVPLSNVLCQNS